MGITATPADVEHVVAQALDGVYAPPVPMGMAPPFSAVVATGGSRRDRVRDVRYVDVDTWAEDEESALAEAASIVPRMEALESATVGGVAVSRVACTTLPYVNPDPRRPELARATASYEVALRAVIS